MSDAQPAERVFTVPDLRTIDVAPQLVDTSGAKGRRSWTVGRVEGAAEVYLSAGSIPPRLGTACEVHTFGHRYRGVVDGLKWEQGRVNVRVTIAIVGEVPDAPPDPDPSNPAATFTARNTVSVDVTRERMSGATRITADVFATLETAGHVHPYDYVLLDLGFPEGPVAAQVDVRETYTSTATVRLRCVTPWMEV